MASKVSISNRALDLIGADAITSFDDGSKAANLCSRNFDDIRDMVSRAYPWNCLTRRASLAALSTAPAWGYANQFQLPEGPDPEYCLRLLRVDGDLEFDDVLYKVEGRKVLTDEAAPLNILYIARVDDPAQFDPLLSEAISAKLAFYLAMNLTESPGRADMVAAHYASVMSEARMTDAQEGTPDEFNPDIWLTSRL